MAALSRALFRSLVHPRSTSPIIATFPFVADPNSQLIFWCCIRSCQPSLRPTNPQLIRVNPQLADIASDHPFFHASSTLCPARSNARAEFPAPPPSR